MTIATVHFLLDDCYSYTYLFDDDCYHYTFVFDDDCYSYTFCLMMIATATLFA